MCFVTIIGRNTPSPGDTPLVVRRRFSEKRPIREERAEEQGETIDGKMRTPPPHRGGAYRGRQLAFPVLVLRAATKESLEQAAWDDYLQRTPLEVAQPTAQERERSRH